MFTIDLTLKNTPLPLSVQRKSEEDAQATYDQIIEAMRTEKPALLELSCDRDPEKKIGVLTSQIVAVVISQKSGAAGAGRSPGFFALTE
ncbi:MAG TPA: hypothetical protein DDZ80_02880 [Cyanobacteria bacterium UBA8803]|nr:hypothetical protein [Cyanobacteria bacterium UBA9273]HBL57523.1 hypothetical protein [Cyanobacteria bacterium UBA8803]